MVWVAWLPASFVLAIIVIVNQTQGIAIGYFTRDPAAIAGEFVYFGLVSNLGVIFWMATASVCLFSVTVLTVVRGNGRQRRFLLFAGIVTLVLGLDDFFLLHELATFLSSSNRGEHVFFGVYILAILAFVWRYRDLILQTDYLVLFFACTLFGLSIVVDEVLVIHPRGLNHLLEDGFKFVGIATWAVYFVRTSLEAVQQEWRTRETT